MTPFAESHVTFFRNERRPSFSLLPNFYGVLAVFGEDRRAMLAQFSFLWSPADEAPR
jgi:hypothetical protein